MPAVEFCPSLMLRDERISRKKWFVSIVKYKVKDQEEGERAIKRGNEGG